MLPSGSRVAARDRSRCGYVGVRFCELSRKWRLRWVGVINKYGSYMAASMDWNEFKVAPSVEELIEI